MTCIHTGWAIEQTSILGRLVVLVSCGNTLVYGRVGFRAIAVRQRPLEADGGDGDTVRGERVRRWRLLLLRPAGHIRSRRHWLGNTCSGPLSSAFPHACPETVDAFRRLPLTAVAGRMSIAPHFSPPARLTGLGVLLHPGASMSLSHTRNPTGRSLSDVQGDDGWLNKPLDRCLTEQEERGMAGESANSEDPQRCTAVFVVNASWSCWLTSSELCWDLWMNGFR